MGRGSMWLLHLTILLLEVALRSVSTSIYNETEAHQFLQYARASFCAPKVIEQWACGTALTREASVVAGTVRVFTADASFQVAGDDNMEVALADSQAYIAKMAQDQGKCIIAFRGSVDLINFYHDFNFVPTDWPNWKNADASLCPSCQVHVGVAQAYQALRLKMHYYLEELQCTSVAITGHSLGAGLASLASMELRANGTRVEPVYTYGKLRVGNKAYVSKYVADATKQGSVPSMWRLVNGHDPVPRLPLKWLGSYLHEPVEVYYPTELTGQFKVCRWSQEAPEDASCSDSVKVEDCISHPGYDHNHYLGLSMFSEDLPKGCRPKDSPVWSI